MVILKRECLYLLNVFQNESLAANNEIICELFYSKIGSIWIFDSFYLFLISPMCLLGFFFNIFAFYVASTIKIKHNTKNLYKYLKVCLLNSSILCFIGIFAFITYSPRYFEFALGYLGRVYRCHIANSVASTLYFFSNILDLLITFERLSIFIQKLSRLKTYSPYKTCFLTFLIVSFINSPVFFWNYIKSDEEFNQGILNLSINPANTSFTYCGRTSFVQSRHGSILSLIAIVCRDFITPIFEITLTIYAFNYYYKTIRVRIRNLRINYAIRGDQTDNEKNSLMNMRLYLMAIIMLIISVVCHLFAGFGTLMLIDHNLNTTFIYTIIFVCLFLAVFKQVVNFFVFFVFNKNFKNILTD